MHIACLRGADSACEGRYSQMWVLMERDRGRA